MKRHARRHLRRPHHRQGVIFILALGTIVILSAMLLVFARNMRTEALASANRLSYVQADAVERGAEMWVLAQCEAYPGDAVTITDVPAEALQVGNGWFWVLHPDPTTDQQYGFGIVDESAKLNVNTASSNQLLNLPGVTQDVTDAIYDWRTAPNAPASTSGAKNSYYESLQEPYDAKNGPYETVEELLLVKDVTQQILYGYDLNHDGVLDPLEQNYGGMGSVVNSGTTDSRGIFNYVTCYSRAGSTTTTSSSGGQTVININSPDLSRLSTALATTLGQTRATQIVAALNSRMPPRGQPPTWNLGRFFTDSGMSASEFGQMFTQLRTTNRGGSPGVGLVNINTAPAQVLGCLPGLTSTDGQTLAGARGTGSSSSSSSGSTDVSWFFNALQPNNKAALVADSITTQSSFYSADIVAVSGDGRAFKRARIVVDARTTPAKVVYRKDLTNLGWPLPPTVRDAMRQGQPPPDANASGGIGATVGGTAR